MLERLGYRTLVAENGADAIKLYRKKRDEIDLVILDMIMPDIGGGGIFDQLKKIDESVKVLLS